MEPIFWTLGKHSSEALTVDTEALTADTVDTFGSYLLHLPH